MKRVLVTSTDVMMIQFLVPHIQYLSNKGYCIDVACSYADGYANEGYHEKLSKILPPNSNIYEVAMGRSPFSSQIREGYKQLKTIIDNGVYDLIWTNEPVMSVVTRLAARASRKIGTKILYLVHGFQFFKGAPIKNWVFFPVERFFSRYCDGITTINWADYNMAKRYLKCKSVYHIDGIGLNTHKFAETSVDYTSKRNELGLTNTDIAIVSVGEVREIKNHETILRAIAKLKIPRIKYIICGCGDLEEYLKNLSQELGVDGKLCMLGHRYDIPEILKVCDIYAQPSKREGLGIAAIEAMAAGLPILTSNVQGMVDYSRTGETGFCLSPTDVDGFAESIKFLVENYKVRERISTNNVEASKKYDIQNSCKQVEAIISQVLL